MNILKKIGVLIAFLLPAIYASAYTFEVDGITYSISSLDDMECTIMSSSIEGCLNIPAQVEFKGRKFKVVGIGSKAFKDASGLTEVNLENPSNLRYIGESAFAGCSELAKVNLECALNLTTINKSAFEDCCKIQKIVIPPSVVRIDLYAFRNCSSLSYVKFMESNSPLSLNYKEKTGYQEPIYFDFGQFNGCPISNAEILRDIKLLPCFFMNSSSECNDTQSIWYYPWISQCSKSLTIGKMVTKIPYDLFLGMNPEELILEDSDVPLIVEPYTTASDMGSPNTKGWGGHNYDSEGKYILIKSPSTYWRYDDYRYMFCGFYMPNLKHVYWGRKMQSTRFVVQNEYLNCGDEPTVTLSIRLHADNLQTFEIGNIQEFGDLSRVPYENLEKIVWNNSIEQCDLFKEIPKLKELKFSNSLQVIKGFNNSPLKEVYFGNNLNKIDGFKGWSSLEKIYIATQQPPILTGFSSDNRIEATLYVPSGCKAAYSEAPGWKTFWNIEEYDFSGIRDVNDEPIDVFVNDNAIYIEKAPVGIIVKIYQLDGSQIYHQKSDGGRISYKPSTDGWYIVSIGDKTFKLLMK